MVKAEEMLWDESRDLLIFTRKRT